MTAAAPRPAHLTWRSGAHLDRAWQDTVAELASSTLAHAAEWHTAIQQAYGHEPLYLGGQDEKGDRGVLPAFIVRRPWFGTVVTSMPFLDAGGPCAASPSLAQALVDRLLVEARHAGAAAVELRCTQRLHLQVQAMEHKVTLALSLPREIDPLWNQLDRGVRNQIRKAQRSGLTVECGRENLDDFYTVFAERMHDLGSPVHGRQFFDAIFAAFGSRVRLVVVRKGRTPIGGLVAIASKDTLVVPWASCLHEYFALCPNMLLYWETMQQAALEGFSRFDFGRSTRGSGTYRFKRQWGAAEEPLYWYTVPIAVGRHRAAAVPASSRSLFAESWRRLPVTLTRQLGPYFRKYLTQ